MSALESSLRFHGLLKMGDVAVTHHTVTACGDAQVIHTLGFVCFCSAMVCKSAVLVERHVSTFGFTFFYCWFWWADDGRRHT